MKLPKGRWCARIGQALGLGREPVKDYPLFPKTDERGIARYVSSDVIRWLSAGQGSFEYAASPDGRRALIQALYDELCKFRIAYAIEPFHVEDAVQIVRSPAELLEKPREGTCLDLTLLFCGACIGFGLLPVVVIVRGHAFAMVSLTHGIRDWEAFGRPERADFTQPVNDAALLTPLLDNGRYVAVECTGMAVSRELESRNDGQAPETLGRVGGQMPFDAAVTAGAAQLTIASRPLLYAVDIATAQLRWRIQPYPLPRAFQEISTTRLARQTRAALLAIGTAAMLGVLGVASYLYSHEVNESMANRLESQILKDVSVTDFVKTSAHYTEKVNRLVEGRFRESLTLSPPEVQDLEETSRVASSRARGALFLLSRKNGGSAAQLLDYLADVETPVARQTRTYLIRDSKYLGWDSGEVWTSLDSTSHVGQSPLALQGLILAISEIPPPQAARAAVIQSLLEIFLKHDDPGVHAAALWTLSTQFGGEGGARLADAQETLIAAGASRLKGKSNDERHWFVEPKTGLTFVYIPVNATFLMGDPLLPRRVAIGGGADELDRSARPHMTRIPRAYIISMTEVSERQYDLSAGEDNEQTYGEAYAQAASWDNAARFCNWMTPEPDSRCYVELGDANTATVAGGKRMVPNGDHLNLDGFRLPTEAEWEYAAAAVFRSRGSTPFHFGTDRFMLAEYAIYQGFRAPAAALKPNTFGLFDMHGGLSDWCDDNPRAYASDASGKPVDDKGVQVDYANTNGKLRIVRGGNFESQSASLVSCYVRDAKTQRYSAKQLGFRVARTVEEWPPEVDKEASSELPDEKQSPGDPTP